MNDRRFARLVRMVGLVQSGQARDLGDLARGVRVSRRTVFRYRRFLAGAGITIAFDRETSSWSVRGDAPFLRAALTPAEADAIALGLGYVLAHGLAPDLKAAVSAAKKVGRIFPPRSMRVHRVEACEPATEAAEYQDETAELAAESRAG